MDWYSDPRIIQGIMETAAATGADPLDLATIMSYETAGTMNPTKVGPTTKWGSHEGFIQFGDPQGQKYGADFSNADAAIRSQLGPNGAVAKYLKASGFKPGMGMQDLYSTVNAGAPGLYNRSDEAAGGAPGTVADKVASSAMAAHRRRAQAMLGNTLGQDGPSQAWRLHPELSPAGKADPFPASRLHPELSPAGPQPGSPADFINGGMGNTMAAGLGEGAAGAAASAAPMGMGMMGMNPLMGLFSGMGKAIAGAGGRRGDNNIMPTSIGQEDPGKYAAASALMQTLMQQKLEEQMRLGMSMGV